MADRRPASLAGAEAPGRLLVCKTVRLFPVRYALSSRPNPDAGPRPACLPSLPKGYAHTLRLLRPGGYVHMHFPEGEEQRRSWLVTETGRFAREASSAKDQETDWIEFPWSGETACIAYADSPWDARDWARNPGAPDRMHRLRLAVAGNAVSAVLSESSWTGPATAMLTAVEEFRAAPAPPAKDGEARRQLIARFADSPHAPSFVALADPVGFARECADLNA
ncbi:MAG: hypothetical protein LBV01_00195 [Deltaproteobacteria bacterium]|jgi:hypothetical protein|nr:hypothetical protein [Deltaproteobacteria bacterium]